MSDPAVWLAVAVLATAVGAEMVSGTASTLHGPLLLAASALQGVVLLAAVTLAGTADGLALVVALVAVALSAANLVGGLVLTDRLLRVFARRRAPVLPHEDA